VAGRQKMAGRQAWQANKRWQSGKSAGRAGAGRAAGISGGRVASRAPWLAAGTLSQAWARAAQAARLQATAAPVAPASGARSCSRAAPRAVLCHCPQRATYPFENAPGRGAWRRCQSAPATPTYSGPTRAFNSRTPRTFAGRARRTTEEAARRGGGRAGARGTPVARRMARSIRELRRARRRACAGTPAADTRHARTFARTRQVHARYAAPARRLRAR